MAIKNVIIIMTFLIIIIIFNFVVVITLNYHCVEKPEYSLQCNTI